jgi:hypothetical protein
MIDTARQDFIVNSLSELWERWGSATPAGKGLLAETIRRLADETEYRGDVKYDLDPGETADWLREIAKRFD